jgi:hypothetical protein
VLVGAAMLAVSTFLPLTEPTGLLRYVQQNTLIQHDGWMYLAAAVALAAAGIRAFYDSKTSAAPLSVSLLAAVGVVLWATNSGMRTLYPVSADGTPDTSGPGLTSAWGISIYVAGLGVALAIGGSLLQRPTAAGDFGGFAAGKKKCPDCAETILADAHVCKHCGYRFPIAPAAAAPAAPAPLKDRMVRCRSCGSVEYVSASSITPICTSCSKPLQLSS